MSSNLDSTSSTQSPPDAPNLPMPLAVSLPPELLLDIFALFSGPPPSSSGRLDYTRYLERNRNLKSLALVQSTWMPSAREVLQEEVYIRGTHPELASEEEIERIARLLIKGKLQGTKYLTVDGHLNDLVAKTGLDMWSQVENLRLSTSSRNDGATQMSDFATFPRKLFFTSSATPTAVNVAILVTGLKELHLRDYNGEGNFLCFDPSDIDLRFPVLNRITIGMRVFVGRLSESGEIKRAGEEDLATLVPITHELFSPSNLPNLRHLALDEYRNTLPTYMILLARVLSQITSLAIASDQFVAATLFPENRIFHKLRHLSLDIHASDLSNLFNDNELDLESLHLSTWMMKGAGEVMSRLIKIAKGEDFQNRIGRLVIYGSKKRVKAESTRYDLDVLEWIEDPERPPLANFDGR